MDLETWKPINQLSKIRERIEKLGTGTGVWSPAADWFESDDDLILVLDAPGIDMTALEIVHDGELVSIRGRREKQTYGISLKLERQMGEFERELEIPLAVQADSAVAQYRVGQLELRFAKLSRTITIEPGTPHE
jgi:HSP20 family molecular chaperone IbpA